MRDKLAGKWADPLRLYLVLAPILYLAFALLTPPFQTPDEHQHLFRAWQLSEGGIIAEKRGNVVGGELPPGVLRAAEVELGSIEPHASRGAKALPWADRLSRSTSIDADKPWTFANFLGSAAYSPAGYGPQVLAIWIGQALDLSVESIVRLGRTLNACLVLVLMSLAFRILPLGRNVLLLVGLLPMTGACAGAFGQDGLVIGTSALLVAIGLRASLVRGWTLRDGALAAALTVLLTYAKFVYLPLAAVALITRSGSRGWQPALAPLVWIGLAALLFAGWLSLVAGLSVPMMPGRPMPAEQLRYVLAHPLAFPSAFAASYTPGRLFDHSTSLFQFSWFSVGPVAVAWIASVLALALVLWSVGGDGPKLTREMRAWLFMIVGAVVLILSFALYLAATRLADPSIYGIQGRYFIPVFLPLLLALGRQGASRRVNVPLWVAGIMLVSNLLSLSAIASAFYS